MNQKSEYFSILIVDDNTETVSLLREYLRDEADTVDGARDGIEALERYKNHRYDLIITDLSMPGMSGIELIQKIREIDDLTEFVIITAYASIDTAIDAVRLGAFDYLIKPFRLEELRVIVKNAKEKVRLKKLNRELFLKLQKLYQEIERYKNVGKKTEEEPKRSLPSDTEHLVDEIKRLEGLRLKMLRIE
ncbi:MAG: response regulator [Desulfobacterota bacterium]|nr:response regulator [Thermodesulfobacteriota bacterium]MDW8002571.1 response regulator [Deltaproteobacteria bacterium]